ncbi:hypothetical protein FX016_23105 [Cupriavidus gilardii]|nr:hypothetical protein FX016_23105 [Cupriavidus gilardii]
MSARQQEELTQVEIHASGTRVLTFLGGDRTLVLGGGTVALYLAFMMSIRYGFYIGVPVALALWVLWIALMRRLSLYDAQFREVFMRHRKYKPHYPARGRFNAPSPAYKDFK